jgi:hypothetical protein
MGAGRAIPADADVVERAAGAWKELISGGDEALGALNCLSGLVGAGAVVGKVRVLEFVTAAAKGPEGRKPGPNWLRTACSTA